MHALEVRDLRFKAPGSETPIVHVDRLVLDAGERLVLRGPSGSGKTSVLRCIVGLERRASGSISFRGRPVDDGDHPSFRADCCYLPQRPVGTERTVADDLAFARSLAALHAREGRLGPDEQRACLDELGLGALEWDRPFERLSTGEQQRVALVRALTLAPSVLLLDEPTASLDPARELDVEGLVRRYLEGDPARAMIWVSHHPQQVERLATRVFELTPQHGGSVG